jgi:hypothetical protein
MSKLGLHIVWIVFSLCYNAVQAQLNRQRWDEVNRSIVYERNDAETAEDFDLSSVLPYLSGDSIIFENTDDWQQVERDGNKKLWRDGETREGWNGTFEDVQGNNVTEQEQGVFDKLVEQNKKEPEAGKSDETMEWPEVDKEKEKDEKDEEDEEREIPRWAIILAWVVGALVLGLLLYLILRNIRKSKKNTKIPKINDEISPAEIPLSEFERALRGFVQNGQYREAVRIMFLQLLKQLIQEGRIIWHKDKTNHTYLNELNSTERYHDFVWASRVYEYVWYGNRNPTSGEWSVIEQEFRKIIGNP